jgi:endonuclease/exonuclease/phosphatase family metal-dependent hydrolase
LIEPASVAPRCEDEALINLRSPYSALLWGVIVSMSALLLAARVGAQSRSNVLDSTADPRGEPELVVCSQNLANYGSIGDMIRRTPGMNADDGVEKEIAIAKRVAAAGCDIVAVQEVLGRDEAAARKALLKLAQRLRVYTNRFYDVVTGPTNDPVLRNGFLFAKDRGEVLTRVSYFKVELPKLVEDEKPRLFSRGPLEIQFVAKPRGGAPAKTITLVTFHFKSKHGGGGDPAQLEWETYRMEMAEALRRVVLNRHLAALGSAETLLLLLGDRNSNFDAASAKILDGTLTLGDFQGDGVCRLSKRGVPLCQAGTPGVPKLFSVLTLDPKTKLSPGSFRNKNEYSWIDEILMPQEALRSAWEGYDSVGDFNSGVIYEPRKASDHAMVYVKLQW